MRPDTPAKARRRISIAGLSLLALTALLAPTQAQEDTDLDLKPADFMPDEPVAIRVDDLQPNGNGSEVAVTVLNRTDHAVTAHVECSLFDADREDLGTATLATPSISPGKELSVRVTASAEGAKRAYCQVKE